VWPRKAAAEPLAPARDEVSVGCAVSDFLLRPAQIAFGKYRKSKTWLYSALP
jgi:hypothetical protein